MIESVVLELWGKKLSVPVTYDCYSGEEITEQQIKALDLFLANESWIVDSENSVKEYCQKWVTEYFGESISDNIHDYILPMELFVKRDPDNPRIAIMCDFKYDPEHGLAIVFSHEGEVTIGSQDIIL